MLHDFLPLLAALAAFAATHSLPALPGLRARLVAACGPRVYVWGHSLLATATLIWLVAATLAAPRVLLWGFADQARWVPVLVMPVACMLLVAGLTSRNPFSLGAGARGYDPARPGIVGLTRHPVLWAAALWSGSHLFPNGEVRAALLFGFLLGFSLMGMPLFDRRRRAALGARWQALQPRRPGRADLAGLLWRGLLGLLLYLGLLLAHGALFGVKPLDLFW
ncbi:NnrU protein [mine drainage metagenome]|uniref:NnrU protein n=1 Tax=mine drainage metagenome TaxID=410659 RepID=A0A1J5RIU1_9ZZZZ